MTAVAIPVRHGSCLQGCGLCCEMLELEINPVYLKAPDVANWVGQHGIGLRMEGERCIARLPIPCGALQPDKSCALYGKPERPRMCAAWPDHPRQLDAVPGCGFSFEVADAAL